MNILTKEHIKRHAINCQLDAASKYKQMISVRDDPRGPLWNHIEHVNYFANYAAIDAERSRTALFLLIHGYFDG